MTKEEFIDLAVRKQLIEFDVKDFFSLSEDEISRALGELASRATSRSSNFGGFPSNFWEKIRKINNLLAMKYYVQYYICQYDDYGEYPRLGAECLTWLVDQSQDSDAFEALECYFDKGRLPEEEQEVILCASNVAVWESFCKSKKQKLSSSLEVRLVLYHEADVQSWVEKFSVYIENHQLDFPGEERFFRSSTTGLYRMEYVRKYGLSPRMRDIMLADLWQQYAC